MQQRMNELREYNRAYYQAHKAEIIAREKDRVEYQRAYYERNKIAILSRQSITAKEYLQTEVGKQNKLANAYRMMDKHPDKYRARYMVRNAVRLGQIEKGVCEVCGTIDVESHHDDYSKSLDVRWFCHQHHCELEGRWIKRN